MDSEKVAETVVATALHSGVLKGMTLAALKEKPTVGRMVTRKVVNLEPMWG